MTNHAELIVRLCEAESPDDLHDWERRDGYYVETCRISKDDVPGLIELMQRWSDPRWSAAAKLTQNEEAKLLPVVAWRALADLKAAAAVEPILDMLRAMPDEHDEWAYDEVQHVFGKIGEPAVEPLAAFVASNKEHSFARTIAVCGVRRITEYFPETRDRVVAILTSAMANVAGTSAREIRFHSTLLAELLDLEAVEAAEAIERAFAANLLDVGMCGDWEEVREELGVEGLGLEMPFAPYDSTDEDVICEGRGIFSDRDIFQNGDVDDEAADTYFDRACDAFSSSPEGKQIIERYGDIHWAPTLLNFGISYLGEVVDQMTLHSVGEFVFDYVPRKVSTPAESALAIIDELTRFWEFIDREYQLPAAQEIVALLKMDEQIAKLREEMSNSENFGLAKGMFMSGTELGYDMTSEQGRAQYIESVNRTIARNQLSNEPDGEMFDDNLVGYEPAQEPIVRTQRVGRNDPCPCGSGKKFKKCCIR